MIEIGIRKAVFIWLLCYQAGAMAAEIRRVDVQAASGIFQLDFEVDLNASSSGVYRLITDYPLLPRLNDMVLESRVLEDKGNGNKVRQLLMHACILFFCKKLKVVERMQENGQDEILATIIPDNSNFHEGTSRWKIRAVSPVKSRLLLQSKVRPDFWIPPVIGPWLLEVRLQRELTIMSQRIEALVNKDDH